MESIWTLMTILGPLLLIGAIVYAYIRNKNSSPEEKAAAERGAREVREDIDRHSNP